MTVTEKYKNSTGYWEKGEEIATALSRWVLDMCLRNIHFNLCISLVD